MPVVDPATRIATWIVDIAPPAAGLPRPPAMAELRPGGSAVLAVRFGKPETRLSVPRSAVVEISTRPYVFVQVGGEQFEKRAVTLGREDGLNVEVISGVKKGERVVEKGGYDVHLASLVGAVESHRH
jgi:cobalt-zinc-cadmium efflux system membrane fusion protein